MDGDSAGKGVDGVEASDGSRPTKKTVALLSGGLDSTLAIQTMLDQDFEVLAVNFVSPFCTCSPNKGESCSMAAEVASNLGVKIKVLGKGPEFLRIIENPRFGHGKGVNPCIDCRIFMLRRAAEIMREIGASCVVTGEVLGQRPMSQHRKALDLVERESGLEGRLLRPLSAKHLPPTIPEEDGSVNRDALLAIRGRSRKDQSSLAKEKGIDVFSCPAGGCLLTDPAIARRARDLFRHSPGFGMVEARLITFGRHFRLHEGLKVVLGRNEAENERLSRVQAPYARGELEEGPGPMALICGEPREGDLEKIGSLIWFYAKKVEGDEVTFKVEAPGGESRVVIRERAVLDQIEGWRL